MTPMVRVVLVLVLFAALVVVAWVVVTAIRARQVVPVKPDALATNAQWAEYYRRLAADAHRSGDTASEAMYESLRQTHLGLDERGAP